MKHLNKNLCKSIFSIASVAMLIGCSDNYL